MATAQCSACERMFTSMTGFDRHQQWNYKRKPMLVCRDPAEVGLIQGNDGRWRVPLDAASRARVENLRAEQVSAGTSVRVG